MWCWRRLLRVPWTARRSNQSILKKISPECSLEGLMLKLKLQYYGHLMQTTHSLEKTWCWERFKAGGEGDDRGGDGWDASLTWWSWVWASSRRWLRTGKPGVLQSTGLQSWTWLSDWTTTTKPYEEIWNLVLWRLRSYDFWSLMTSCSLWLHKTMWQWTNKLTLEADNLICKLHENEEEEFFLLLKIHFCQT